MNKEELKLWRQVYVASRRRGLESSGCQIMADLAVRHYRESVERLRIDSR